MHLAGRPVASFDPEGLIFSVGIESKMVKLYDLRSFDKVGVVTAKSTLVSNTKETCANVLNC